MRIVINQSNYFPWIGYFALMAAADVFIFLDDAQYTTHGWRNRNQIRISAKNSWISIPCGSVRNRLINQVTWADNSWRQSHWNKIENAYCKAPYFKTYSKYIHDLIFFKVSYLSELNQHLTKSIYQKFIGDKLPQIYLSEEFQVKSKGAERVLDLCRLTNATNYLSGPAGQAYLHVEEFEAADISISWANYAPLLPKDGQAIYSIIDDIFYDGPYLNEKIMSFCQHNPN